MFTVPFCNVPVPPPVSFRKTLSKSQLMCPIGNPEMLSTSHFYDGNVIYVVWKDKLA